MSDFTTQSTDDTAAEIELLRAEIEQLQYELAERDSLLTEVTASTTQVDQVADTETSGLAERLEQLLDELERSDGRIDALEQLLQASEETSRAEQEERRQLEAWMTDIETRIVEREADWDAESKALRRRLQEAAQQRDELIETWRADGATTTTSPDPDHEMLARLGAENSQLRQALEEAQREQSQMAERCQQQLQERTDDADAEMRAERLALAQERASLTRQRAELTAMRNELEGQPGRPKCEIDGRVRVFREHLREIQQQEEKQRNEQSLSARVSRIWKRLEKRT